MASLVLAGTSGWACQIVGGYEQFHGESAATPTAAAAGRCDAVGYRAKAPPSGRGPLLDLIELSGGECFWMDHTEVTVSQYQDWLSDLGGEAPDWDRVAGLGACDWKGSGTQPFDPEHWSDVECFTPEQIEEQRGNPFDPVEGTKPMRCVDWCEAKAFCTWAGKQLCYDGNNFGSAFYPPGKPGQWSGACSAGDEEPYPFDAHATGRPCNYDQPARGCVLSPDGTQCGPWPVDSEYDTNCSPAPGMPLDLGGNVAEWVDLCGKEPTADAACNHRGGSYVSTLSELWCGGMPVAPRRLRAPTIGFRCCAELDPDETLRLEPQTVQPRASHSSVR